MLLKNNTESRLAEPQSRRGKILFTIFAVFLMLIAKQNTFAGYPVPEKLIEIVDFEVVTGDSVLVGDTIPVNVSFRAKFDCQVGIALPMYGGLTTLNDTTKNYIFTDTITVQKDTLNTMTYYIKAADIGTATLGFVASIKPEDDYVRFPMGFSSLDVAENVHVNIGVGSVSMCVPEFNVDLNCNTFGVAQGYYVIEAPTNLRAEIHVNGNIKFYDYWEPQTYVNNKPETRSKGALNNVWLFFRHKSAPTTLYHPRPFDNDQPIKGVHYDQCNEQGGYSFNFNYLLDSLPPNGMLNSSQWELVLIIGKENEAIRMTSSRNHFIVNDVPNPDRDVNFIKTFPKLLKPGTGFESIDPFVNNNLVADDIFFSQFAIDEDGAIFRHTTLARKFLISRLEVDPEDPIEMGAKIPDQIEIREVYDDNMLNQYSQGIISIVHKFNGARSTPTSNLMAHEWAHYYHGSILGFNGSDIIDEGWAIFFANAFMNWEEKMYDDRRDWADDCEMGPYFDYLASFTFLKDGQQQFKKDHNVRFGNISKTNFKINGVPYGHDMSRFACYLWNIYDSYQEGNYKRPAYEGYENDDVHGLGKDVFDCFIHYNQNYESLPSETRSIPEGFNNLFKTFAADSDTELQASIQKIYDFMEFGDNLDINHTTVKMPPPPVEVITFHQEGQLSYVDVATTTYPASIGDFNKRWFTSTTDTLYHVVANFSNIEDGVEITKFIADDWRFHGRAYSWYNPYRAILNDNPPITYKLSTYSNIWDNDESMSILFFSYGEKPEFEVFKIGLNNTNNDVFDDIVFPNPSKGTLNIKSPRLKDGTLTINVYDINGVKIHSVTRRTFGKELNLHLPLNITNGIYYFDVLDANENTILIKNSFIISN